jgi:hypothetical protein
MILRSMFRARQFGTFGTRLRQSFGYGLVLAVSAPGHHQRWYLGEHGHVDVVTPRRIQVCETLGEVFVLVPRIAARFASEHQRSNDLPVAKEVAARGPLARFCYWADVTFDGTVATRDVVQRRFEEYDVRRADVTGAVRHCGWYGPQGMSNDNDVPIGALLAHHVGFAKHPGTVEVVGEHRVRVVLLRPGFAPSAPGSVHVEPCRVPGLMEALIPRKDESHGSTEEVPRGASGSGDPDGGRSAA